MYDGQSSNSSYGAGFGAQQASFMNYSQDPGGITGLAGDVGKEITTTMRSVRDTMAISFQTLNLTLASLNGTMRNVATAVAPTSRSIFSRAPMIPAGGAYNAGGAMSFAMQQHLGNTSTMGLFLGQKPFNVSNMEYGANIAEERNYRLGKVGLDVAGGLANLGVGYAGYNVAKNYGMRAVLGTRMGAFLGQSSIARGAMGIGLGLGGMALAGAVAAPVIQSITDAGQQYVNDTATIKRLSNRFGPEFTRKQASQAARGIYSSNINELFSTTRDDTRLGEAGYRDVLMGGMSRGLFRGTSPDQLKKQLENAAGVVKFLTGIMGSKDITEAMDMMSKMKSMGVNLATKPGVGMNLGTSAYKYGAMTGVGSAQMMQMGLSGGSIYQGMGMAGAAGMIPMMRNMAMAHEMEKRKLLSTTELAVGGGVTGVAGNVTAALGGLMRSGAIGDVMLAAGMKGGMFNQGTLNGNMKGGYFGALGQATNNIINPSDFANFYLNKESLLAQQGMNGEGQANTVAMLKQALKMMPFQGKNMREKGNLTGAYIKQILGQMGQPNDVATVKMLTEMVMHPNAGKSLDREAQRQVSKGWYGSLAERQSVFGGVSRLGDGFGRMAEAIPHYTTQALGRWGADKFMGALDRDFADMTDFGPGEATPEAMKNYMKMGQNHLLGNQSSLSKTSSGDVNAAFRQSGAMVSGGLMGDSYPGMIFDATLGASPIKTVGSVLNFATNNAFGDTAMGKLMGRNSAADYAYDRFRGRSYSPVAGMATYGRYADYYKAIAQGGQGSPLGMWGKMRNAFGLGGQFRDFAKLVNKKAGDKRGWFQNADDQAGLYQQATAEAIGELKPGFYEAGLKDLEGTDAWKNFQSDAGGNSAKIMEALGIADANSLDGNAGVTLIGNKTNDKMAALAKSMGMSQGQLADAWYYNKTGSHVGNATARLDAMDSGRRDLATQMAAAIAGKSGGISAKDKEMANMMFNGKFSDTQVAGYRDMGFSDEMLDHVLSSKTGMSDMDNAMKALGALADGDSNGAADLMDKINNSDLKNMLDDKANMDPSDVKAYLNKFAGLKGSSSDKFRMIGQSALSHVAKATGDQQLTYLFGDGEGRRLSKMLGEDGNVEGAARRILGLQSDDTQVQDIQSQLGQFYQLKAKGGSEYADFMKEHAGIDVNASGMNDKEALTALLSNATASGSGMKELQEKQDKRDNSAYQDAMTKAEGGADAFRVVVVQQDKTTAKEEMKNTKVITSEKTVGSSFKNNGYQVAQAVPAYPGALTPPSASNSPAGSTASSGGVNPVASSFGNWIASLLPK